MDTTEDFAVVEAKLMQEWETATADAERTDNWDHVARIEDQMFNLGLRMARARHRA